VRHVRDAPDARFIYRANAWWWRHVIRRGVLSRRNHFVIISSQEVFHLAMSLSRPLQRNVTFTVATTDVEDELVPVRRDRCKKRGPLQTPNRSIWSTRNPYFTVIHRHKTFIFCNSLILSLISRVANDLSMSLHSKLLKSNFRHHCPFLD